MSVESNNPLDISTKLTDGQGLATPYFEDYLYNNTLIGDAVSNAVQSTVSVDSPDATDLASVITLVNEMKADIGTLVTDLNNAVTQMNALLASLRDAERLDE